VYAELRRIMTVAVFAPCKNILTYLLNYFHLRLSQNMDLANIIRSDLLQWGYQYNNRQRHCARVCCQSTSAAALFSASSCRHNHVTAELSHARHLGLSSFIITPHTAARHIHTNTMDAI